VRFLFLPPFLARVVALVGQAKVPATPAKKGGEFMIRTIFIAIIALAIGFFGLLITADTTGKPCKTYRVGIANPDKQYGWYKKCKPTPTPTVTADPTATPGTTATPSAIPTVSPTSAPTAQPTTTATPTREEEQRVVPQGAPNTGTNCYRYLLDVSRMA
jgi:hypothetical protein